MKKLIAFLCSVLAILFMNVALLGTAEAFSVAVIPIDVDVKVERAGDFNSYYWDMLIDRFRYPDYELLDDDKVAAVVPETGLKTFDKAALSAVAEISRDLTAVLRIGSAGGEITPVHRQHHRKIAPRAGSPDGQEAVGQIGAAPGDREGGVFDVVGEFRPGVEPVFGGDDGDPPPRQFGEDGILSVPPVPSLQSAAVEEDEERGGGGIRGGIPVEEMGGVGAVAERAFCHRLPRV